MLQNKISNLELINSQKELPKYDYNEEENFDKLGENICSEEENLSIQSFDQD